MTNKQLGIAITLLIIAALAVNASGVNLQGFLQKKPTDSTTITPADEKRPVLIKRQGVPTDGGGVQFGQGARQMQPAQSGEYVEYQGALPGVGQRSSGGPGSAYMDDYYRRNPRAWEDESGNAAQIGDGRPAEVPGLPSLAEIERQRRGRQ